MEKRVVSKAKILYGSVLTITKKSPKKFKPIITNRMQNLALDIIERINQGNGTHDCREKLKLRHEALTSMKILRYVTLLGREQGAICPKQYEQITKNIYDVQNSIGIWIENDRRRFEGVG